jgi:hypothetical protein
MHLPASSPVRPDGGVNAKKTVMPTFTEETLRMHGSARTPKAENNAAKSDHVQHPSLNATNQSRDRTKLSVLQLHRVC